jgi:hypothetical protein
MEFYFSEQLTAITIRESAYSLTMEHNEILVFKAIDSNCKKFEYLIK